MSTFPLSLAAPAALAAFAYLDAKTFFSYDAGLIWAGVKSKRAQKAAEEAGHLNLFYILEDQAQNPKNADRPLLVYQGKSWTYPEFYNIVLKYGQWLKNVHGVKSGDIVALDCMNRPNFLFLWFGLWSLGAPVSFINYNLTGPALLHSIKTSNTGLVLVDQDVEGQFTKEVMQQLSSSNFRPGGGSVVVSIFSDALEDQLASTEPVREPDECRATTTTGLASLIFTSGTTGNPKAGYTNWIRYHAASNWISRWLKLIPEDRFYTCMPMYHSAASTLCFINSLLSGCTVVLGHKFGTRSYMEEVRESNATVIQYVGETCRYLLAAPPSPLDNKNNVRLAFGNGLRPDIWDMFKERFGIPQINEFYAATEGVGSTWNRSRNSLTRGAVGRSGKFAELLNGGNSAIVVHSHETEMPFRDPETGFCVKVDTRKAGSPSGELLYKLPDDKKEAEESYSGYYGNKEASEKKLIRNVFEKGDAYYRTGDLLSKNPMGFLYFHDRIGDTFRWRSENVSTNEVADVISSYPSVSESNVYGVAIPNHDGRAGCAAVILKNADGSEMENSTEVDARTLDELAKHALKNLPRYAVPIFLRFPKSMQRTGTNKQQKHHLREQGADPSKVSATGDKLFWLKDGTYKPFREADWQTIVDGKARL